MTGLYLHIPFCRSHCPYCSFVLTTDRSLEVQFVEALQKEVAWWAQKSSAMTFSTFYAGGGTPSILSMPAWGKILKNLKENALLAQDVIEQTLEVNPDDVTPESAQQWQQLGFNRISLGVQSFQKNILVKLGRHHQPEQIDVAFHVLRKAGFNNISCDLIFAVPEQTEVLWQKDLEKTASLQPNHVSLYCLSIEEGSPWHDIKKQFPVCADDAFQAQLYDQARDYFSAQGYRQYEVASFAKPGYRSLHNQIYWTGENYLGLGPGAHSLVNQQRWANASSVEAYLQTPQPQPTESYDSEKWFRELLVLGLRRVADGVNLNELSHKTQVVMPNEIQEGLNSLKDEGLINEQAGWVRLTYKGVLMADRIASELI